MAAEYVSFSDLIEDCVGSDQEDEPASVKDKLLSRLMLSDRKPRRSSTSRLAAWLDSTTDVVTPSPPTSPSIKPKTSPATGEESCFLSSASTSTNISPTSSSSSPASYSPRSTSSASLSKRFSSNKDPVPTSLYSAASSKRTSPIRPSVKRNAASLSSFTSTPMRYTRSYSTLASANTSEADPIVAMFGPIVPASSFKSLMTEDQRAVSMPRLTRSASGRSDISKSVSTENVHGLLDRGSQRKRRAQTLDSVKSEARRLLHKASNQPSSS